MNDADPNLLLAPPSTCRAPTVRPCHHACREPTSRPSQRLSAHPCQEATTTFPPADLPHLPRLTPASPTASETDSAMYPTPLVPPTGQLVGPIHLPAGSPSDGSPYLGRARVGENSDINYGTAKSEKRGNHISLGSGFAG